MPHFRGTQRENLMATNGTHVNTNPRVLSISFLSRFQPINRSTNHPRFIVRVNPRVFRNHPREAIRGRSTLTIRGLFRYAFRFLSPFANAIPWTAANKFSPHSYTNEGQGRGSLGGQGVSFHYIAVGGVIVVAWVTSGVSIVTRETSTLTL